MKLAYYRLLLLLCVLMGFTACESDEGENLSASVLIIGDWEYDTRDEKVFIDGQALPQILVNAIIADYGIVEDDLAVPDGTTITFNSNNTYSAKLEGNEDEIGTWVLNAEEDILTLNPNTEDVVSFVIERISNSRMVIKFVIEENIEMEAEPVEARLELTIYFNKI